MCPTRFLQVTPNATSGESAAAGRSALVTSLMVCAGYIVCFTPFQLIVGLLANITGLAGNAVAYGSWFYNLAVVVMFTNSCINPFIYAAK